MGDVLTLDKIKNAAVFGPKLCGPVATLITHFEDRLPADKVLALSYELVFSQAYLEPDSGLAEYYYNTLLQFKKLVKNTGIRADFFTKHYDLAIDFFKTQLKNRKPIKINCKGSALDASTPIFLPLSNNKINADRVKKHLANKFGIKIDGSVEEWLGHRIFFNNIKADGALVIVIVEKHSDHGHAIARMKLLDRLLQFKDSIDLRFGFEAAPQDPKGLKTFFGSDLEKDFQSILDGGGGTEGIMRWLTTDPKTLNWFCKGKMKEEPGLTFQTCRDNMFFGTMRRFITLKVMNNDPSRLWMLGDPKLDAKMEKILKEIDRKRTVEEWLKFNLNYDELQQKRSIAIAEKLLKTMPKKPEQRRIVLLSVGVVHAFDVVRMLEKEGKFSTIGLMPRNTSEVLKDIAKLPE